MKLERITEENKPGYPSFKDHTAKRRGLMKTALGGMLAVLAAGCNVSSHRPTGGVIVAPQAPEESAPDKAPAAPSSAGVLPLEPPVAFRGEMAVPAAPAPQAEPHPALPGEPPPPAPPPPPPPRLGGMPMPPKEPEQPVPTKGVMMAPVPTAAAEEK